VLAVGPDGTLYARSRSAGSDQVLARSPRTGAWRALTAPASGLSPLVTGDGRPAVQVPVGGVAAAAVGIDGSVYLAQPHALRRISPDGVLTTLAGTDDPTLPDAPPPPLPTRPVGARDVPLPTLRALAVERAGAVLLVTDERVLRVTPRGMLEVVAAGGVGAATPAARIFPYRQDNRGDDSYTRFAAAVIDRPAQALYLLDGWSGRVVRLDLRSRRLELVVGVPAGGNGYARVPDGNLDAIGHRIVPAVAVRLPVGLDSLALTPDGDLLVAAGGPGLLRVGRVASIRGR
jgi:hypothetical protein